MTDKHLSNIFPTVKDWVYNSFPHIEAVGYDYDKCNKSVYYDSVHDCCLIKIAQDDAICCVSCGRNPDDEPNTECEICLQADASSDCWEPFTLTDIIDNRSFLRDIMRRMVVRRRLLRWRNRSKAFRMANPVVIADSRMKLLSLVQMLRDKLEAERE
jgi:hypothetical protein